MTRARGQVEGVKARLDRKRDDWEKTHVGATKRQKAAKEAAKEAEAEREKREELDAAEDAVLQAAEEKEQRRAEWKAMVNARNYRAPSLGQDRYSRQYFWFTTRKMEVLIHDVNTNEWGVLDTKEQLDALLATLNVKGQREKGLKERVTRLYGKICNAFAVRQAAEQTAATKAAEDAAAAAAGEGEGGGGVEAMAVEGAEGPPSAAEQRDTYEREVRAAPAHGGGRWGRETQ